MKRAIAITANSFRHPFRRSLPSPVINPLPKDELTDMGFFLASFASWFVIFFVMIF